VTPKLGQSGAWIGMGGMAVALFLYAWSALVLQDLLFSVALPLLWLVFFVLSCRWFMTRPYRVLSLPMVAIAVWFAAVLSR
jgi:hypothetical protein